MAKAYVREGLMGPTVPNYPVFNPGWAEVNAAADLGLGRSRHHPQRA